MPSWLSEVRNLKLKQLIPITIRHESGYYYISNAELDITEGGSSLEQALREFADFFLEDYLNWRDAKDSELTSGYKDYGIDLLKIMKLQLKFESISQLVDFLRCPLGHGEYIEILRSHNEL